MREFLPTYNNAQLEFSQSFCAFFFFFFFFLIRETMGYFVNERSFLFFSPFPFLHSISLILGRWSIYVSYRGEKHFKYRIFL